MENDNKELTYQEKLALQREEIQRALNVNGYEGFLDFDDDIFLLDYWDYEDGLNLLIGIAKIDFYSQQIGDDYEEFKRITTLDHDFYTEHDQPHITYAFLDVRRRLERIWKSGAHPEHNPPSYYIDWAISKKHEIPWLKYAIEKGFYKLASNNLIDPMDKPLSNRERDTLLVIIASLAKEADIPINKTAKAASLISNLTQIIGAPVGETTIETHLKKIPQALEKRGK